MKHPWPVVNGTKDPSRRMLNNGSFGPYAILGECSKYKPVLTGSSVTELNRSCAGDGFTSYRQ